MTRYVGVDVGKAKCRAALMDQKGTIEKEFFFENNPSGIDRLLAVLTCEDRVVVESTGNLWLSIYDALEHKKVKVVLANPMKTKAIAYAKVKTDKVDARILAHLLRADLVAESYVPPQSLRDVRELVRHRISLVRMRTMVKNKVHALIDKYGYRCEYSDMFGKSGLSLSGIDVYSALLIHSEIGGIGRFADHKKLVSWAGLAPSVHQSGDVEYNGSITKRGSSLLRYVMVESARTAVRYDEKLGGFYERVRSRRGDGKAVVAVAAKMLKIVWFMLVRREAYGCVNERRYGEKLKKISVE